MVVMRSASSREENAQGFLDMDLAYSTLPAYKNYIAATTNGVVRLDENTPESIKGASTSYLKTCCAVIMYVPGGNRVSLAHHFVHRTDLASYEDEVKWVDTDPHRIKVILAQNRKLLSSIPAHAPQILLDLHNLKKKLSTSGILEVNMQEIEANYGAVTFNRETQECIIYDKELPDTVLLGTPYPYTTLRQQINYFMPGPRIKLDLQYFAGHYTSLPFFAGGFYSLQDIQRISSLGFKEQRDAAKNYILQLPQVRALKGNKASFAMPEEFNLWLNGQVDSAMNYTASRELYEAETGPYVTFALDDKKRALITSLGGAELAPNEQGMCVFQMPSRMLTKEVRDKLAIERVRLKDMNTETIPEVLKKQLNKFAKGWVGEDDFQKEGSVLITFPYHDNSERSVIKAQIEQASRAIGRINTASLTNSFQGMSL